jgi:hypothetical protein
LDTDASSSAQFTCGSPNGRFWQAALDKSHRIVYVLGYLGALAVEEKLARFAPEYLTVAETADAVSILYADPVNLLIPTFQAIRIVAAKCNGEVPSAVETALAQARLAATYCREHKKASSP